MNEKPAFLCSIALAFAALVFRTEGQDDYAPVPYNGSASQSRQPNRSHTHTPHPTYYREEESFISKIYEAIEDRIKDTIQDYATRALDKLNFWIFTGKSYDDQSDEVKFDHDARGLITPLDPDKLSEFTDTYFSQPLDETFGTNYDESNQISPSTGVRDNDGSN